jgi:predicted phage terminase large subunit-like protein
MGAESQELLTEARRAAMRGSFAYYSRRMFKARKRYSFGWNAHHQLICDALQSVVEGHIPRLILCVPPRYSKSELVAVSFPSWAFGLYPDSEFIMTSYSATLAAGHTFQARSILRHELYRETFPDTRLRIGSSARDHWRTTADGAMYAAGALGTITGFGAGKMRPGFGGALIIDDPHKLAEAKSEVIRPKVIEWFQETLESRLNSQKTPIILIMQRVHEEDLAGWLINGGNGEEWTVISLPALLEDGTALWPEKHSVEALRRLERSAPYTFASQYQQRPAPLAGGLFKVGHIPTIDAVPATVKRWVRGWDLGSTVTGDPTVGVLLGLIEHDHATNVFSGVVADVVRFTGGPEEVETRIVNTARSDPRGTLVSIPKDPGQASATQIKYLTGALAGFRVTWSPESGDKETRAEPVAAQCNVGNISMVRGDWNREFLGELRNFPNGKHDDQVDGLSRAFGEFVNKNVRVRVLGGGPKHPPLIRPKDAGNAPGSVR